MRCFLPFNDDWQEPKDVVLPFDHRTMNILKLNVLGDMHDGICEIEFQLPAEPVVDGPADAKTGYGSGAGA